MASITINPNGDGTLGPWTDDAGGTSGIYAGIDEGTDSPNDSDYIEGVAAGGGVESGFFTLGDMPVDFDVATAVTIKIRVKHTGTKGDFSHLHHVQLVESDESTAVSATFSIADTTTIATYSVSPGIIGSDDKATWDDMRLKIALEGTDNEVQVFAVEVVITYDVVPFVIVGFDPCPESLKIGRIESWLAKDHFDTTWPGISNTHDLTKVNTPHIERAGSGRGIIGPAARLSWTDTDYFKSTDAGLMPSGDHTVAAVIWHDNVSDLATLEACFWGGMYFNVGVRTSGAGLLQTSSYRMRLYEYINDVASFEYVDTLSPAVWDEPYLRVMTHDSSVPETIIYTIRLLTGDVVHTRTVAGVFGTADEFIIGRFRTTSASTYNGSHCISDCITVSSDLWTEADALVYQKHICDQYNKVRNQLIGLGV